MLKKMFLALLLLNSMLFAENINLRSVQGEYSPIKNNITFIISAIDENAGGFPRKQNKDWVALYKKGDSNAWKNVLTWGWSKDFASEKDGDALLIKENINLDSGEYEVRYFLNNSYTTYKSSSFKVGNNIDLGSLKITYNKGKMYIIAHPTLFEGTVRPNPKDWIGLYKKGDSNDWANVITWFWAKDSSFEAYGTIGFEKTLKLAVGEYEARYFLNNSFTTYKSASLKVENQVLNLEEINGSYHNNQITFMAVIDPWISEKLGNGEKDWVALYKKGDSNAWKNVLTWDWAKNLKFDPMSPKPIRLYSTKNINLQNGEYEVRYFRNNSYTTYQKSEVFTVND